MLAIVSVLGLVEGLKLVQAPLHVNAQGGTVIAEVPATGARGKSPYYLVGLVVGSIMCSIECEGHHLVENLVLLRLYHPTHLHRNSSSFREGKDQWWGINGSSWNCIYSIPLLPA